MDHDANDVSELCGLQSSCGFNVTLSCHQIWFAIPERRKGRRPTIDPRILQNVIPLRSSTSTGMLRILDP
jgi:hypothetical protein